MLRKTEVGFSRRIQPETATSNPQHSGNRKRSIFRIKEVSEEELAEIERYENMAEYQPSADDYNLYVANQETDAPTDYWSTQDHQ